MTEAGTARPEEVATAVAAQVGATPTVNRLVRTAIELRPEPVGATHVTLISNTIKTILISSDLSERGSQSRRRGASVEAYIERRGAPLAARQHVHGQVDNVLRGMEAAFIDAGLPKNCFLYVDDVVVPGMDGPRAAARRSTSC